MEKNKLYLSWKWVDDQINKIGDKLESIDLEFVSGIPRGGLIPAVMMSHAYGIKYISYSSAKMLPLELRKKTIVIDDISDTGLTMSEADKLKFITSSLTTRVGTKTLPRLTGELISDDRWLVFPWETLDSIPVQDYLMNS
jgi:hypoxanthine phosphoribosyltransferase|tara:strand:+ start:1066 stop:1485 length:420 start_codon:yes stop_codon:yes gene_type:complete